MNIAKLRKLRNEVKAMDDGIVIFPTLSHNILDKTTQAFLERLLDGSFNKLSELIFYNRLVLKTVGGSPTKPSKPAA